MQGFILPSPHATARMRAALQLPAIEVIVIMHVMQLLVQSPGIWRHASWDLNPSSQQMAAVIW